MEFLEQLEKTKRETLRYFDLPEEQLRKTYGPGKWNVRYLLHHIADSESVLYYRIRRVLSECKQVIWATDAAAWAEKLNYSKTPLNLARNVYTSSREGIFYYAQDHYALSHEIHFVHSEAGLRTLKEEFDKVVLHNRQHLASIEKALTGPEQ